MPPVFKLRTDGAEPTARFGEELAESDRTYVLYNDNGAGDPVNEPIIDADLRATIQEFRGTTRPGPPTGALGTPGGRGSLDRVMPACDPVFASLFADTIDVRVPRGEGHRPSPRVLFGGAGGPPVIKPADDGYADYNAYELSVKFTSRPYAVVPNSRMTCENLIFDNPNNTQSKLFYYAEWKRFVQRFVKTPDLRVSASVKGGMKYSAPGSPLDNAIFEGIPDMMIPDCVLVLRWFGVPLRYLYSQFSFLTVMRGAINQKTFLNYAPGRLLYIGCEVQRSYTPPQFLTVAQGDPVLLGTFAAEQLCDLDLQFILTTRTRGTGPIPAVQRPNLNWLDAPHNWLPNLYARKFFYAHASTTPNLDYANWVPSYLSGPFEALFQDPDVPELIVPLP